MLNGRRDKKVPVLAMMITDDRKQSRRIGEDREDREIMASA